MTKVEGVRDPAACTLTEASRAARGRYPLYLLASSESRFAEETHCYVPPSYSPELHILDSEWYFTSASSRFLANRLVHDRACLLGTPTVALQMRSAEYVLVDRSPYLLQRFPSLPATHLRNVDVHEWQIEPGHGSVLLDPPWYFPEFEQWLEVALQCVALGGVVMLPLLGEQTRPTAQEERDRVLNLFSSTGHVEVVRDAVEYDIPLFEARALSAAGVTLSSPWRRADLAVAHVSRRPKGRIAIAGTRFPNRMDDSTWETFLIGTQVVKLRSSTAQSGGRQLLVPIDGLDGFTLDSVSRRDPRIADVDIWSSRNRVARVLDAPMMKQALRIAADIATTGSSQLRSELEKHGFGHSHINELFKYLEVIDDD